jgi:hypothetical protein
VRQARLGPHHRVLRQAFEVETILTMPGTAAHHSVPGAVAIYYIRFLL